MFTSKNTNPISLSTINKWVKFLFILTLCTVFFSSCSEDDELTPEEIEEHEMKQLAGTWKFTNSEITSPFIVADSTDYRNIVSTLEAVGNVNSSELELNANGNYTFTNQIIGGGSYEFTGRWTFSNEVDTDFIQLEGFYKQLFVRLNSDTDFFSDTFAENFKNFRIVSKTNDEIVLANNAIISEQTGVDAPPKEILVEGSYTIERQ